MHTFVNIHNLSLVQTALCRDLWNEIFVTIIIHIVFFVDAHTNLCVCVCMLSINLWVGSARALSSHTRYNKNRSLRTHFSILWDVYCAIAVSISRPFRIILEYDVCKIVSSLVTSAIVLANWHTTYISKNWLSGVFAAIWVLCPIVLDWKKSRDQILWNTITIQYSICFL